MASCGGRLFRLGHHQIEFRLRVRRTSQHGMIYIYYTFYDKVRLCSIGWGRVLASNMYGDDTWQNVMPGKVFWVAYRVEQGERKV